MIGMVGKDARRAEQLLGEHRPGEQMRPGRPAEGEEQVGAGALGIVEAVGAADQEARLAPAVVAPAFEPPGEGERAELLAFLVEQDGDAVLGRRRRLPPLSGNSVTFTGQAMRFR